MSGPFVFSRQAARQIARVVHAHENNKQVKPLPLPKQNYFFPSYIAKVGGSAIAARSGTTVTSGTVTIYSQASGTISTTTETITAFNLSETEAAAASYVVVVMDMYGSYWITDAIGGSSYAKQLCRFTAGAAFTTSSASVTGTVVTQIGEGTTHGTTTGVTFNNLLTSTASTYTFEGDSGDAGLAFFSTGTTWQIIQMECP